MRIRTCLNHVYPVPFHGGFVPIAAVLPVRHGTVPRQRSGVRSVCRRYRSDDRTIYQKVRPVRRLQKVVQKGCDFAALLSVFDVGKVRSRCHTGCGQWRKYGRIHRRSCACDGGNRHRSQKAVRSAL